MIDDKGCSANQEPGVFPGAAAHISRVVCTGGFCPMVGGSVCGIAEKLRDSLAGDGFRKEGSLREFPTNLLQPVRLRLGLNAFGDYFQVKSPGKHDDDTNDFGSFNVRIHARDKRTVNLQSVDGKTLQPAEGRVAGAEVVDVQAYAKRL